MNRLNTILIVGLGVQVALAVLLRVSGGTDSIGEMKPLFEIDRASVTKIQIFGPPPATKDAEQQTVVLVKDGDEWKLASAFDYPVRSEQVDTFLGKVEGAESRRPIAKTAPRHKQLRVADDQYERKVVITHGGGDTVFYLGGPAGGRRTAIRLAGSEHAHGVSDFSASAAALAANLWVASEYFKPAGEITALGIDNSHGSFSIEKLPGEDNYKVIVNGNDLVIPEDKQLNTSKLASLFRIAGTIRLVEPASTKGAPTEGQITVTVKTDKGEQYYLDAAIDGESHYHVHERDNPHSAKVNKSTLLMLFELKADDLLLDKKDDSVTGVRVPPTPGHGPAPGPGPAPAPGPDPAPAPPPQVPAP